MPIRIELITDILERSLDSFFAAQGEAIVAGVSERNSCARLGLHLEREAGEAGLEGYFADPEYDRKQGGQIKTILDGDYQEITICCDLILHSRGASIAEDNLIAVEMKKSRRPKREKVADRNRLRAMTKPSYDDIWSNDGTTHPEHVCGYRLGVYIELNNTTRTALIDYFMGGERTSSTTKRY